jgi:hypothetical protein
MNKPEELKVFISNRESICDECGENLGTKAWIFLNREKGVLCLSCADLDQLEFLPSGNMALTVRSKKYSKLYAVVLKWSRARKQYERQGLLVQGEAIEKAEQECLNDAEFRERRRVAEAERRAELDQDFIQSFSIQIRNLFPSCPKNRETVIAEHACKKYSGRIGRTASAKKFDEKAITLAVIAHIRHTMTNYDELLCKGTDRFDARSLVAKMVEETVQHWSATP